MKLIRLIRNFCIFIIFFAFLTSSCFAYDYYGAGKKAYQGNKFKNASYFFWKALKKHPDNAKYRYYYAQTLFNLHKFDEAQDEYEKVIETAPQSNEARLASIGISEIQRYKLLKRGIVDSSDKKDTDKTPDTKLQIKSVGDNYIENAIKGGEVTRWLSAKMPIKLYIERASKLAGYKDYYFAAVNKAINDWTNSVPGNLISYKLVNNPEEADIKVYFVNEIMKKTGKDFIAGLATPYIKGKVLQYYRVELATMQPLDNRAFTENQMYTTALHELGHSLGIRGHSSNKKDIMYSGVEFGSNKSEGGLTQRDINTLTLLYSLDPDIANFDKKDIPAANSANSAKNEKVLGTKKERLNKELQDAMDYVKKYPKNVLSWNQLGHAYFDLEQYKNAVTSLKKAVEIDSSSIDAIETLAFTYKAMENFNEACKQFQKLIDIQPDNIAYSNNYALYLIKNKQIEKAKSVLSKLLLKNPKARINPDIKNLMNYLSKK